MAKEASGKERVVILIDKLCYTSKLRYINAGEKFAFSMLTLIFCVVSSSAAMGFFIIALTSAFKTVDHLYIMTKGGPGNATNMLLFYIYQTGFDYWNNGKASAMTVILVGLLLIITAVKFFYDDRKAYYND